MKKKKKSIPGKPFKKGNPGGPGRPAFPDEVKQVRKMNAETLIILMDKYSMMTLTELSNLGKDLNLPAIELIVVRALVYALRKNDTGSRDFIIERLCGKVANNLNVEASLSSHKSLIDEITED